MASKRKRTVLTVEDRVKCKSLSESGYKVKEPKLSLTKECNLQNNSKLTHFSAKTIHKIFF